MCWWEKITEFYQDFIQMKPALALPVVTLRPTGLSPSEQKLTEMQHSVLSSLDFLIIIIILFQ